MTTLQSIAAQIVLDSTEADLRTISLYGSFITAETEPTPELARSFELALTRATRRNRFYAPIRSTLPRDEQPVFDNAVAAAVFTVFFTGGAE